MSRSKALQIYMKPGIPDDDLMLEIWDAARELDRPQNVFRAMLRHGLRRMLETGEISQSLIDKCDLKLPKTTEYKDASHPALPAYPYPGAYPPPYGAYPPPMPSPAQMPVHHAPAPAQGYERPAPDTARETPQRPPEAVQKPSAPKVAQSSAPKPSAAPSSGSGKKGGIGDLM